MNSSEKQALEDRIAPFLRWLAVEKGRARNTVASYGRDLRAFGEWLESRKVSAEQVDESLVESYLGEMRGRQAARSSQARALASLRSFFGFLVDEGAVSHNPAAKVSGVRVPDGLPKPLTVAEMERLLASVTGEDALALRDRAAMELLYATGARVSELCGLELADIATSGESVRLRGKGDKERIVPLGSVARAALWEYLAPRARGVLAGHPRAPHRDRNAVFLTVRGRRLTRQKLHDIVTHAASLAGLAGRVSPHVFRHSCATHMLEHGADMRVVQEMLGHATISTTQIYTKVSRDHLVETFLRTHPRSRADSGAPS